MALNVTTAVFAENCNTATASPSLAQWDTEQVLQISGIELPDSYKVEFSTVYTRNAIPEIGDASGVTIPNVLLQRSAPITAYVVLYGENGGRNREYWITIHITPGQPPETTDPDPEQADIIDQAIAALNNGVARTEAAATSAEGSASDAADHAADAEAWAVGQRDGVDVPDTDPTYRNNAKYYAGAAEAAAEEAGRHEASWESWVRRAETAADDAEGSARAAAGSKADAETAAQKATQKATEAGNSAAAAAGSAASARQTVDGAIGAINTARDGALTQIGSAGSNATASVNQAGTTQTERVTTEGNTQVNRVQAKGDEVINSIPQDYTDLVDDVDDLSRQLSDVEEFTFNDNLIGVQQGVYYKVDPPIKNGESFILSVADGTTLGRYVDYTWYDAEKTQLGTKRLYATTTSQVTKVSGGDVHYFYLAQKPAKFIKLERGTTATAFTPFFQPYLNYALGLNSASDYYKQKISYPESFVNHYSMNATTGVWGNVNTNYNSTEPIWLNAGDVLHYRLCTAAGEALINTYNKNGLFIENLVIGTGNSNMIEGTAVLAQDCFVVVSHRFWNVANEKTYFYVNDSIFHDVSEMVTEPEVEENTFVSGYGTLDGWQPHAEAFSKMMMDVQDTEGFMFFTDSHFMSKTTGAWEEYAQQIFAYLEKLYYSSPCSFVLHGGDWLGSGEARENYLYKFSAINGAFRRNFDKFALLVGNHESGNQSAEHTMFTHDTLATTLLANVGKTYYRFNANTFHLYCFDSWQSGAIDSFAEEQIAWFADSLTKETADHIVIAIHILHDSNALRPIGEQITLCAKAYNDSYDFSSATGKVAFVIAGHTHADATGVENDIPYIETVNATGFSETTFVNLPLPVDLMKVDWNTGKLTAYRAARGLEGTTRELTIVV